MATKTVCISFDFATDELHVNVTVEDDDGGWEDDPDPGAEEDEDEPAREVVSLRAAG